MIILQRQQAVVLILSDQSPPPPPPHSAPDISASDRGCQCVAWVSSTQRPYPKANVEKMHFGEALTDVSRQGWLEALRDHKTFLDCERSCEYYPTGIDDLSRTRVSISILNLFYLVYLEALLIFPTILVNLSFYNMR